MLSWIAYLGYVGRVGGPRLLTDAASWMKQPRLEDVADEKFVICRIICICLLRRTLALIKELAKPFPKPMSGCCLMSSRPALRPSCAAEKARSHSFNSFRSFDDRSS